MPIPKAIARLNRVGLNRLTVRVAPHAAGFGVVIHHGRRSGRSFRTPVNVFTRSNGYRIALTYGADSDWVQNVLAARGCLLETRGQAIALVNPRLVHDPSRVGVWMPARPILGLLHVDDFLDLDRE